MFLTKYKKSPYYQVVYFVDGKRTKKSTGTADLEEAKKFLATFTAPHHKNNFVVELNPSLSLSEFRDEYIGYSKLSKSKYYIERSIEPAFKFFIQSIGDKHLRTITLKEIDNFILNKFKHSQSAAALYYRTLKAAFTKAVSWNYIDENTFKKIKLPKVTKSLPVFISEKELQKILGKTTSQLLKNIFSFAFYTGMRLGEILNMQWDWIDFNQNIIVTKNSNGYSTKSKKERIIPIHKKVKALLKQQAKNKKSIYVFSKSGNQKLNENFVSKEFKKALRASKLNEEIHFHTLRHSFASNLVQKGASLYVVKELLGHEDIKTTQVYSHLKQSSLSNAICLL